MPDTPATTAARDRIHALKTWDVYFDAIYDGRKPFEVRYDDRGYQTGDVLLLQRWEPDRRDYTRDGSGHPATISKRVSYVLTGGQFGVQPGYVVMGLQDV